MHLAVLEAQKYDLAVLEARLGLEVGFEIWAEALGQISKLMLDLQTNFSIPIDSGTTHLPNRQFILCFRSSGITPVGYRSTGKLRPITSTYDAVCGFTAGYPATDTAEPATANYAAIRPRGNRPGIRSNNCSALRHFAKMLPAFLPGCQLSILRRAFPVFLPQSAIAHL